MENNKQGVHNMKAWMKKHPIITVILGIIVLIFIINIFSGSSNTKVETSQVIINQSQTFEDRIKALAVKTGTTGISYNGIDDEKADPDRPAGSRMITIKFNVTSYYSADAFYENTGTLTGKIFQETFASNPNATDVIVWYYGEVTDKYGNKSNDVMLSQAIDKKTFEKINWQNFDSTKICDFLKSEGRTNNGETTCSTLVSIK